MYTRSITPLDAGIYAMSFKNPPALIIIGNGIAGITAARVARKLLPDLRIKIISDETDYFFSRTALMYIYMGHVRAKDCEPYDRSFYAANRLELVRDRVVQADFSNKKLSLASGEEVSYDLLLLALGSRSNKFGWPGQDLEGVTGLYSMGDLKKIEESSRLITEGNAPPRGVIVGGGLIGVELAEMLHSRGISTTFLVREDRYMPALLQAPESAMVEREIRRHEIDLRLSTELKEILGDDRGRVRATVAGDGAVIPCGLVGLTAGVSPNLSLVEKNDELDRDRGILADSFLRTSVPDVFTAGDCAQSRHADGSPGRVYPLWYTGRAMGEIAGMNIAARALEMSGESSALGPREYRPGVWFNSAKFFTIEYQIYGEVPPEPEEDRTLYWEHPNGRSSLRLYFTREKTILGFQSMGPRLRQETCEKWIREQRPLSFVLENIGEIRFEPEFSPDFSKEWGRAFQANAS